jgi:O-antigen ligase
VIEDTSKLVEIIAALSLAVGFFIFCYLASPRVVVPWLICLSPFQALDNPYASSSVLITYVVGIAYIMRGKLKFLPMFGIFLAILGVYAASTGFQHRATHLQHGLYIFNYISAILMFYIVYNFVRETKDVRLVLRTLIILNVLVSLYSIIQITLGKQTLFGLEELTMRGARQGDEPRLEGPYGVGVTAEFLVIHILLASYLLIYVQSAVKRNLLYLLISINLACLLATGNRGGFLVLIGGAGLFLYMYRSRLGLKRTLSLSIAGSFLLVLMSVVVISFTNYGVMYDRLEATELEGGVPDTRGQTWALAWSKIPDKPLLGHGPRFRLQDDYAKTYPGHEAITYPHNLYLFLLYTVGVSGLVVYLVFFGWMILRIRRGARSPNVDPFTQGLVQLGVLVMIVFLIDQMKVEFLRYVLIDYWHYIFSIFAIWLALADVSRNAATRSPGNVTLRTDHSG